MNTTQITEELTNMNDATLFTLSNRNMSTLKHLVYKHLIVHIFLCV